MDLDPKAQNDEEFLAHARVKVTSISPLRVDLRGSAGSLAVNLTGYMFTVGEFAHAFYTNGSKPFVFPDR